MEFQIDDFIVICRNWEEANNVNHVYCGRKDIPNLAIAFEDSRATSGWLNYELILNRARPETKRWPVISYEQYINAIKKTKNMKGTLKYNGGRWSVLTDTNKVYPAHFLGGKNQVTEGKCEYEIINIGSKEVAKIISFEDNPINFKERINYTIEDGGSYMGYPVNHPGVLVNAGTLKELERKMKIMLQSHLDFYSDVLNQDQPFEFVEGKFDFQELPFTPKSIPSPMAKMNWKLVSESKPDFNKVVLLLEKTEKTNIVETGSLKSIDANGLHWNYNAGNDIWSTMFSSKPSSLFKPTHWCEITLP